MAVVAESFDFVIGVDTHAKTHTLAVVTPAGLVGDTGTFPTSSPGLGRATSWVSKHTGGPEGCSRVLVSMEGTGSYGARLAAVLTHAGYQVVEAITPTSRARGSRGKNDPIDAQLAARTVLPVDTSRLTTPRSGNLRAALRVLVVAREEMNGEATRAKHALLALLRITDLGVDARGHLTGGTLTTVAAWRGREEDLATATARTEATRLAKRVLALDLELAGNKTTCQAIVAQMAPRILELPGVGPITAAITLLAFSHPGRIHSEAAFAALAGACPIPASSGNTVRHRLNRGGDRRLNRALHTIVLVRTVYDQTTREYVQRRTAQGRTRREIVRCLKRYVARQLYRTLNTPTAMA